MRLNTKLIVLFLLVAWVPLGVSVGFLTQRMEDEFASTFEERSATVQEAVGARFQQVEDELSTALGRIAADTVLDEHLLQPLAHGQFYKGGDHDHQRDIVREARRLITASGIDTLRVVDLERGGHVIALGHRRGEEPADEAAVAIAREATETPLMRVERVDNRETGSADEVWTIQVVRVVDDRAPKGRVALVGGRVLDEGLLRELLVGSAGRDAEVALDARGVRVAATFEGDAPAAAVAGWDVKEGPVIGARTDAPAATLTVWVSRAELTERLAELWRWAGLLAGGSGVLALLLGLWLSRRLSRPLEALAAAASEVAAGRRDLVVREPRGRDEVAELTRAFNQMTMDLDAGEERLRQSERVAAWSEIARRIAHEIKNPLFPIQMSIETLQKVWKRQHPDFEEIFEESTETILEEVERMKRIVTEFSNFARMPAPKPGPVDLAELARSVVGLQRDAVEGVALEVTGVEELTVSADQDQLRQVLINLVSNAAEALGGARGDAPDALEAPEAPRVEVRVEPGDGGGARVVVTDNGPGMDEDTLGRLFTPYFTTKAAGTGLGLAIVHRIIAEHGGSIRVDSTPGVGTRFVVALP